jgi:hypothetical protein
MTYSKWRLLNVVTAPTYFYFIIFSDQGIQVKQKASLIVITDMFFFSYTHHFVETKAYAPETTEYTALPS